MASFSYNGTLHCKGDQEFIDEFQNLVENANFKPPFTSLDLRVSPTSMTYLQEEIRYEIYKPFKPLMNIFTQENEKPLSFFFEFRRDNSFDNTIEVGYFIFENGELVDEDLFIVGKDDTNDVKRKLAEWLEVECDISDDAVDEEWLDEFMYFFCCFIKGESLDAYSCTEYKTLELCLAALSQKTEKIKTREKVEEWWQKNGADLPVGIREKAVELELKGYYTDQIFEVPNYLKEKVLDVLISGKGFSEKELRKKIKKYTAKDIEEHKDMLESDDEYFNEILERSQNETENYDEDCDDDDINGLTYEQLMEKGNSFRWKLNYEKAIEIYKKVLDLEPEDPDAKGGLASTYGSLAYTYFSKEEYAQAFETVNQAIELEPDYANFWDTRAEIYEAIGKYEKAIADCKKALELDPDKESSKKMLERCQNKTGDDDNEKTDDSDTLTAKQWNDTGWSFVMEDNYKKAIEAFNKALELEPDNKNAKEGLADALKIVGMEYGVKGDHDGVIKALSQYLTFCPDDVSGLNNLAYSYMVKKDYANAVEKVSKAIKLAPDEANFWDTRAEIYEAMGEYDKAIADCKKALELNPDLESSKEILERCQKAVKQKKPAATNTGAVCPSCGKTARQGAKFCSKCGTKFDPVCAACGRQLKATSKFCPGCGTKV